MQLTYVHKYDLHSYCGDVYVTAYIYIYFYLCASLKASVALTLS